MLYCLHKLWLTWLSTPLWRPHCWSLLSSSVLLAVGGGAGVADSVAIWPSPLPDLRSENMYLYANPDGSWEVNVPVEEVPTELPEPTLGINFARDGMQTNKWLTLIAIHSDSWLIGVAFYLGAHAGFGRYERRALFKLINELPTVFEVWSGFPYRPRDQPGKDNNTTKPDSGPKVQAVYPLPTKVLKLGVPKGQDTGDAESSAPCCGMKKFMVKAFR